MYGNAFCLKSLPLFAEIYSMRRFKHDKVVFLFIYLVIFVSSFLSGTKIKLRFSINDPICVTNIAHVTNTDNSLTFVG